MRCDAPLFLPADYDYIIQCAEKKPRDKVLRDLTNKYRTSQKRIYQIWRGEEKNRVAWDQPINRPPLSFGPFGTLSSTNVIDKQDIPEVSVECNIISGSKVKKTGGKKPKSKSVRISEPSITQNQPTSTSPEGSEGLNISREDLNVFYEKEAKRDEKNKAEVNRRLAV
jgi:hypothetical protein